MSYFFVVGATFFRNMGEMSKILFPYYQYIAAIIYMFLFIFIQIWLKFDFSLVYDENFFKKKEIQNSNWTCESSSYHHVLNSFPWPFFSIVFASASSLMGALAVAAAASSWISLASLVAMLSLLPLSLLSHPIPRVDFSLALTFVAFFRRHLSSRSAFACALTSSTAFCIDKDIWKDTFGGIFKEYI